MAFISMQHGLGISDMNHLTPLSSSNRLRRSFVTAIIDIGSNSVRLVVFSGPRRNPALIFNEKIMAGLGGELAKTGRLSDDAIDRSLAALKRFKLLIENWQCNAVICVATAAVRDAQNGGDFAQAVRNLGFDIRILTGAEEAQAAGHGVISAIPQAKGVVGDLGGGSLELAHINGGMVKSCVSLPVGVLRLPADEHKTSPKKLRNYVAKLMQEQKWGKHGRGQPFYLVGGSWRALARVDMHDTGYPLTVFHNYRIPMDRVEALIERLCKADREELRCVPRLPGSRIDLLLDAAQLLDAVIANLQPSELIVSAYGLREGLLYQAMPQDVRLRDPFIDSVRRFGRYQSRFGTDGTILYDWVKSCFPDMKKEHQRFLLGACHLADVGWQANPDFRSERGLEMALHGNWVGIDAKGRAMVAQALFTAFGAGVTPFTYTGRLAEDAELAQAAAWGLAIRLGQRLSGGLYACLNTSRLYRTKGTIILQLGDNNAGLVGEMVERRLAKLASFLQSDWKIEKDKA